MTRATDNRRAAFARLVLPGVFALFLLTAKNAALAQTNPAMQTTPINIQHVSVLSTGNFEATTSAFEAQLGTFDPHAAQVPSIPSADEVTRIRERIAVMAGPSGFMQFDAPRPHGTLLPLVGQSAGKATQYTIGHALTAVEMTRYNLAAGLYAPLRVLIYEDGNGATRIDYDLPSSLFGQFGDERITEVGRKLDQQLSALVATAIR